MEDKNVLREMLLIFRDRKKAYERADQARKDAQNQLVLALKSYGQTSISTQVDGLKVTGSLVESITTSIDEERLKKALGSALWSKVTKKVLDKDKLEALMQSGQVDAYLVAQCSHDSARQPYVKITEKSGGTHGDS